MEALSVRAMHFMRVCIALALASARAELMPIFMMHGVKGSHHDFDQMVDWLIDIDPTVVIENLNLYEGPIDSFAGAWTQQKGIMDAIRQKVDANPDVYRRGYVFLCHSQGALLCRSVVQDMDDHQVHTYVSMAGPHMGEFGIPLGFQDNIPWGRDFAWPFFYNFEAQERVSIAGYWHDPRHRSEFLEASDFLAVVNNEPNRSSQGIGIDKNATEAARYKANFLRLEKVVFLMGGKDEVIIPIESSHFGFYNEDASAVVPLEKTAMWSEDWIGLRTLNASGRLIFDMDPDANHFDWHRDKSVFLKYILPRLPRLPDGLSRDVVLV